MFFFIVIGFSAYILMMTLGLTVLRPLGERWVVRVCWALGGIAVALLVYANLSPEFWRADMTDIALGYLAFLAATWAAVSVGMAVLWMLGLVVRGMDKSPLLQVIVFMLLITLIASALFSNRERDCDVVWTHRGAVCE